MDSAHWSHLVLEYIKVIQSQTDVDTIAEIDINPYVPTYQVKHYVRHYLPNGGGGKPHKYG